MYIFYLKISDNVHFGLWVNWNYILTSFLVIPKPKSQEHLNKMLNSILHVSLKHQPPLCLLFHSSLFKLLVTYFYFSTFRASSLFLYPLLWCLTKLIQHPISSSLISLPPPLFSCPPFPPCLPSRCDTDYISHLKSSQPSLFFLLLNACSSTWKPIQM